MGGAQKNSFIVFLGGSRLCRESHLIPPRLSNACGRWLGNASPPSRLPRGERGDDKGQRPLVFDLRGLGGSSPQERLLLVKKPPPAPLLLLLLTVELKPGHTPDSHP